MDKQDQVYKIRHTLAHVMAQAVLKIRPDAKMGFGPPIDTGFYYDFDFGDNPIGSDDLKKIEKFMKKIMGQRQEFEQFNQSLEEAESMLAETDQSYKIEYAKELVESGRAENGQLGFYRNGPFVDMCEGPHLENTGKIPKGCFKLDKIAGSYWRGDEKNPMLTRIYGHAFETADELKEHLERLKKAEANNHRRLGKQLSLFTFDDEVGVGLPLWLPNGTVIRDELEKWANEEEFRDGFQKVNTPCLTRGVLYERSGHLDHYEDGMFPPMEIDDGDKYYLRPMNCPHHHKCYDADPRSYRDLPLRLAEYGDTFRYERHGSLSGLLRVRAMCMNDAHIYCTPEQVAEEFNSVIAMYRRYYDHLRIGEFRVRLSLHEAGSDKYVDNEDEWLRSEDIVRRILTENGVPFEEEVGEAAFYGPKIDIQIKNLLGREETVSTCQLDFVMAERFELTYTDNEGNAQRPYIIHRAPLSTHERLVSFLIELYGGAFPTWLAPIQLQLIPVNEQVIPYAKEIADSLRSDLIRVRIDDSADSFNKKIRNAVTSKIPNMWILGNNEMDDRTVTWRRYSVREQKTADLNDAIAAIKQLYAERMMDNFADVNLPLPEVEGDAE